MPPNLGAVDPHGGARCASVTAVIVRFRLVSCGRRLSSKRHHSLTPPRSVPFPSSPGPAHLARQWSCSRRAKTQSGSPKRATSTYPPPSPPAGTGQRQPPALTTAPPCPRHLRPPSVCRAGTTVVPVPDPRRGQVCQHCQAGTEGSQGAKRRPQGGARRAGPLAPRQVR